MSDPKDVTEVDVADDLKDGGETELEPAGDAAGEVADVPSAEQAESAQAAEDVAVSVDEADGSTDQGSDAAQAADGEQSSDEASAPQPAISMGDLLAVGIISLIMGVLMVFIASTAAPADETASDLSGGVAITVNGVSVGENEVTEYITQFRASQQLSEDDAWGEWLVSSGYTPETLRQAVTSSFVSRELVKQAVADQGIEVADEKVEEFISQTASQIGGQEELEKALSEQGMAFEEYRQEVKLMLAQQALAEKVAGDVEVTDDEILEMIKLYSPDAVDEDATSLEGVNEDMVSSVRDMLKSQKVNDAFSSWMADYQSKAEIKVEDMPAGLPYAIDLTKYEEAAQAAADEAVADTAESGDEDVASDDAAASESASSEDAQ